MSTKELIKTQVDEYEGKGLLLYINEKTKNSFTDFALAIVGLGTGVVGQHLEKKVATDVAKKLATSLSALGYALTVSEIISMIQDNIDANKLEAEIKDMDPNKFKLRVTTKTYVWLSGSGNHMGYTADVTYKAI